MTTTTLEQARAAKDEFLAAFGKLAEVVGVGIARIDGGYVVKVNLCEPPTGVSFPADINGVPVRVEVAGPISKR